MKFVNKYYQEYHSSPTINDAKEFAKGTIRVSLGKNNTIQDARDIAEALIKILV